MNWFEEIGSLIGSVISFGIVLSLFIRFSDWLATLKDSTLEFLESFIFLYPQKVDTSNELIFEFSRISIRDSNLYFFFNS
jgi:hypothetical protein